MAVNRARCRPPLPTREVQKIARSIFHYEESKPVARAPERVQEFARRHRAQVLEGQPWPGRSGDTDRDGYAALLDLAEYHGKPSKSGNVVVSVSIRDFALRAGIHENTARERCLPRLQKMRLLYRRPKMTGPGVAGEIVLRDVATQDAPIQPTFPNGGIAGQADETRLYALLRRARHGAKLTKADARALRGLLTAGGEATPVEVCKVLGHERGCDIRRRFRRLEPWGVVRRVGGDSRVGADRWRVADDLAATIERSAPGSEMKEIEAAQRTRNDTERAKYGDALERRKVLLGLSHRLESLQRTREGPSEDSGLESETPVGSVKHRNLLSGVE